MRPKIRQRRLPLLSSPHLHFAYIGERVASFVGEIGNNDSEVLATVVQSERGVIDHRPLFSRFTGCTFRSLFLRCLQMILTHVLFTVWHACAKVHHWQFMHSAPSRIEVSRDRQFLSWGFLSFYPESGVLGTAEMGGSALNFLAGKVTVQVEPARE